MMQKSNLSENQTVTLTELKPSQLIEVISRLKQGGKLDGILEDIAAPIVQRVQQVINDQYTTLEGETLSKSNLLDRGNSSLDATIDQLIGKSGSIVALSSSVQEEMYRIALSTPLRINYEERLLLHLLESVLEVSEYTDRADARGSWSERKRINQQTKHICSILSGLLVAHQYELGQELLSERSYIKNANFFQQVFEIGRRYKILNPERMRDSYGKLMYFLMDTRSFKEEFEFDCIIPIQTVWSLLSKKVNGLCLLKDPLIRLATAEIMPEGKPRKQVQWEIEQKERAIQALAQRYATKQSNQTIFTRFKTSLFLRTGNGNEEGVESGSTTSSLEKLDQTSQQKKLEDLSEDEIKLCIYSLGDRSTFLRFNRRPCDRMIAYLQKYFQREEYERGFSLAIHAGENDSRLSHSHERQYNYVLQSLTLWREVLDDMLGLWSLAEVDLLDTSNPYTLKDSGQGLHRVQEAPHIYRSMCRILTRVQKQVGTWYGSSEIHLGDHNVPNALLFIDKYLQVPRILSPIVLCLEKIPSLTNSSPAIRQYIDNTFVSETALIKTILSDFFRHAFDGSGADNFYDAGSCVDGRLTSAWNWCSKIESKSYFPIFLLTGFTGFDGRF